MATYVREYSLTITECVAIEAESEADAARIFDELEHCDRAWFYLRNEVYNPMMEYLANNTRDIIASDIKPCMGVYQDEDYAEETIDPCKYITKE